MHLQTLRWQLWRQSGNHTRSAGLVWMKLIVPGPLYYPGGLGILGAATGPTQISNPGGGSTTWTVAWANSPYGPNTRRVPGISTSLVRPALALG